MCWTKLSCLSFCITAFHCYRTMVLSVNSISMFFFCWYFFSFFVLQFIYFIAPFCQCFCRVYLTFPRFRFWLMCCHHANCSMYGTHISGIRHEQLPGLFFLRSMRHSSSHKRGSTLHSRAHPMIRALIVNILSQNHNYSSDAQTYFSLLIT